MSVSGAMAVPAEAVPCTVITAIPSTAPMRGNDMSPPIRRLSTEDTTGTAEARREVRNLADSVASQMGATGTNPPDLRIESG